MYRPQSIKFIIDIYCATDAKNNNYKSLLRIDKQKNSHVFNIFIILICNIKTYLKNHISG